MPRLTCAKAKLHLSVFPPPPHPHTLPPTSQCLSLTVLPPFISLFYVSSFPPSLVFLQVWCRGNDRLFTYREPTHGALWKVLAAEPAWSRLDCILHRLYTSCFFAFCQELCRCSFCLPGLSAFISLSSQLLPTPRFSSNVEASVVTRNQTLTCDNCADFDLWQLRWLWFVTVMIRWLWLVITMMTLTCGNYDDFDLW